MFNEIREKLTTRSQCHTHTWQETRDLSCAQPHRHDQLDIPRPLISPVMRHWGQGGQAGFTNKFDYHQPNLTRESMHSWLQPVLWRASHFHLAISHVHANHYIVNCAESVATTSKFVLIQPIIDWSSDQYWFWRGFIAFFRNIWWSFASSHLIHSWLCYLWSGYHVSHVPYVEGHSRSHPKHTFKLPHLHVLWLRSLIRNNVNILQYCSCCVTSLMCQRVDTGDSNVSYFSIYIWSVPL